MYIGARKFGAYNTILNILAYTIVSISIIKKIDALYLFLSFFVIMSLYIFNVFSLERGRYNLIDTINSLVADIIGVIITAKFFELKSSLSIFSILYIFQNISKPFLYKIFVKKKYVMLVGKNENAEIISNLLEEKQTYHIAEWTISEKYKEFERIISEKNISKLIITDSTDDIAFADEILRLKLKGIQVFNFINFYEKIEEKVPVLAIDKDYILFGSGYDILHATLDQRIKRLLDLFLTLFVGILTLPIMIISAIIVKLESRGPVFFRQSRIGLGNEPFTIYKFRSMKVHDENAHSKYAQDKDDRITKFGKFMRKSRIDELPQLINVLKGEMSFIGPRAEWDKLCKEYETQIPFYKIRHSVKPGLTGWAQVKYPYGMGVEDALEKLRYDLYYIKHQNLAFDIMVLFKTVKIVVFGRGK
ncbi:MAG: exopolysaccharide biosynthesis polyprenyl glycosylphosphotransferase [Fusobacteriaceae bacterium]|nr:exopolysaccharide biosynthesis polyprenyl glycosylphosphotransferase [Fusobacteriaceae bacterium]